jgi:(p)ppGpp synthase/HD superfamily hydrolase
VTATIATADALARIAHHGQVDKAGRDYIDHPRAVAHLLVRDGYSDDHIMAGLLHDIVEDTPVTFDDLLLFGYPRNVVRAVDSVTRREGPQYPDGKEPYMDLIRRAAADPIGRVVKLMDNTTNSDPARLALLTAEERAWFTQKYAKARAVLQGEGAL